MTVLPKRWEPNCTNINILAGVSGALVRVTALDGLFPLRPEIHWALSGAAADRWCRGNKYFDDRLAMATASGFAGGMLAAVLVG